jgi:hypothetical protein
MLLGRVVVHLSPERSGLTRTARALSRRRLVSRRVTATWPEHAAKRRQTHSMARAAGAKEP